MCAYICVRPRLRIQKERDKSVYMFMIASPLLYGVWQLHHVFVMLIPLTGSLQTLPSACEEGCSGGRSRLQATLTRSIIFLSHPLPLASYFVTHIYQVFIFMPKGVVAFPCHIFSTHLNRTITCM